MAFLQWSYSGMHLKSTEFEKLDPIQNNSKINLKLVDEFLVCSISRLQLVIYKSED